MKNPNKETAYLVELPHLLGQIVHKRRYLLRTLRTSNVGVVSRRGTSTWLKTVCIPNCDLIKEESWDGAHLIAARFLNEMSHEAYVEPAAKPGRYNALLELDNPKEVSPDELSTIHNSPATPDYASGAGLHIGFGSGVRADIGLGGSFRLPGTSTFTPQANILPPQVEAIVNAKESLSKDMTCPMLYKLSGWSELSEVRKKMFETEAAQTIKAGLNAETAGASEITTLGLVVLQPSTSRALKTFLRESLAQSA